MDASSSAPDQAGALAASLHVAVSDSPALRRWHAGAHLVTACVALMLPVSLLCKALLAATVAIHARATCRAHARRRVTAVVLDMRGRWQIVIDDGEFAPASLRTPCIVLPWLIVLRFATETGRRHTALMLTDNVPPDAARRLRVRLRAGRGGSTSSQRF